MITDLEEKMIQQIFGYEHMLEAIKDYIKDCEDGKELLTTTGLMEVMDIER